MVKLPKRLLRSIIHRIVSPSGAQAEHARYNLVYLARPEHHVFLKRLERNNWRPWKMTRKLRRSVARIGLFGEA